MQKAGGEDGCVYGAGYAPGSDADGDDVGAGVGDDEVLLAVFEDLVGEPHLLGAGAVGEDFHPWVDLGAVVNSWEEDRGPFRRQDGVEDVRPAADVQARAVLADDPPVLGVLDPNDLRDPVPHGVAEGEELDLLGAGVEVEGPPDPVDDLGGGEPGRLLPRDDEAFAVGVCKPHRPRPVIDAYEHPTPPPPQSPAPSLHLRS